MDKKICIITGANSGIGKQAAIQIAASGYHVIIGCRNTERGNAALKDIISESQGSAELILVDMSLKSSIKSFSDKVTSKYSKVDVLIHNAAIFDIAQKERKLTSEGYESIWMTNHVGPVYLTELLMDALKNSNDARVITVSSKGLLAVPRLKVDIADPEFAKRKFSVTKAYYQSKRAQVMYTYWLSDKIKDAGVTANSVRVTAVKIDINRHPELSAFTKWVYKQKSKKSITPQKMAQTYTHLATNPDMKGVTGKYFDEKNQEVSSIGYTKDKHNIDAVMELTQKYLK
jgi:NAD(P)-dependent dehydrogenase (short-subunit alcohol dehydrogenase family)